MKELKCNMCKEVMNYEDEVVFDGDELKTVDEQNPDWSECTCITCFYIEEEDTNEEE